MTYAYGSLFSGCGGMDRGFEQAGFRPAWHAEIDGDASSVLRRHWRDVPNLGSVTDIHGGRIEPVDVMQGGSPCQDVSQAGTRAGLDGARSGLFFDYVRIVRQMREATNGRYPAVVVLENVDGLLSSNRGRDFAVVLARLQELGAAVAYRVLDAQFFGVPQRRRRVFVVADFAPVGVGEERAAQVLALREGLCGHPAPGDEAREATPRPFGSHPSVGRECSISICTRQATKRSLCNTHYQRWRTTGHVDSDRPIRIPGKGALARFREKVNKTQTCWLWTGAINESGYGIFAVENKSTVRAHRFSYEIAIGPIPEALTLDHLCKVKRCIRPDHLEAVTSGENTRRYFGGDEPLVYQCQGSNVGPLGTVRAGNGHVTGGVPFLVEPLAFGGNNCSGPIDVATACLADGWHGDFESETFIVTNEIASTIQASAGHHGHSSPRADGSDNLIAEAYAPTVAATLSSGSHASHAPGRRREDGALGVTRQDAVAIGFSNRGDASEHVLETIRAGSHGAVPMVAFERDGVRWIVRRLTPTEGERLQGYPDGWTRWRDDGQQISDSARWRLIGNGVASPVAHWLATRLMAALVDGGRP